MAETKAKTSATKQKATSVQHEQDEPKKKIVPKDIDMTEYVTVRNGFHGKLIYKSKKTGEIFVWESFGDEQDMELRELRNAKNSAKKFFINNWFMFDDDWIVDFLGLQKYYKNAVSIEDFDKIFEKSPTEIGEIVETMSKGQKRTLAYRANQLIRSGEIDSNKAIASLEKSLGVELVER